jgi:hypothetical protein
MQRVRELLMARDDEELILLFNEWFFGVVRESADVRAAVFKADSLSMLLRQAVVAACSAVDVYYPAVLREYLPQIIRVKQRNFIPTDRQSKDFMRDFQLSLEDSLRLIADAQPEKVLGELFFEYLKRKTLSNSQGVAFSLQVLGVDDPWSKIAQRLEVGKDALMKQFDGLVSRRNDIVHRGDRSSRDSNGAVQPIHHSWAESHIHVAHNIVSAANELVTEQMTALGATEPVPTVAADHG